MWRQWILCRSIIFYVWPCLSEQEWAASWLWNSVLLHYVQEGESPNFTCSSPFSSFYALHWGPAKSPKKLFVVSVNADEKEKEWVRVTLNTKEGYSSLYIRGLKTQPHTSVPPHSAAKPPAAHTQSHAYCCSGTSAEEEPCVGCKRESQWTTVFSVIREKWNHRLTGIPVTVVPSTN